jgi:hypothetical protein
MGSREDGADLPLNRNSGTDNGQPLVNDHHGHSAATKSAVAEELEEEEEDVVFVMGHDAGTTWSPERRT